MTTNSQTQVSLFVRGGAMRIIGHLVNAGFFGLNTTEYHALIWIEYC